jgi:hypothetical protein
MKKIMFNDKYGLTDAVLSEKKTMTRRLIKENFESVRCMNVNFDDHWHGELDGEIYELFPTFKLGKIVAIGQSYSKVYDQLFCDVAYIKNDHALALQMSYILMDAQKDTIKGWTNKMFIKPDLMIHHIRITDIKVDRLQEISDEDCLKEGVYYDADVDGYKVNLTLPNKGWGHKIRQTYFQTPREAFAHLIDKVSGKGTWERNPFVFVYSFKLID